MPGLLLSILLAVAAEPRPARGNLQGLFSGSDYPLVALRKEEQGAVTVRLGIDPSGFVRSCKVTQSSGSRALDDQTCSVLRARAQFEPATDSRGRSINSTYTQTIRWQIAGQKPPPLPRHPWMVRSTIGMSNEGKLVSCNAEITGMSDLADDCKTLMSFADSQGTAAPAAVATVFAISELYFYPVDPEKAPEAPKLADASQVARQTSRVTIGSSGTVTSCEGVAYADAATPDMDACQFLRGKEFEPAPAGSADLVSTVVVTAYVRTQTIS